MLLAPIILNFFPNNSDKELSFDVDDFSKIATQAETSKSDLLKQRDDAVRSIEELRKNWNTPGGRKFFESLDSDWAADVQKYVKTMDAFIDVMDEVITCFREIEETVGELNDIKRDLG